MSGQLDLTTPQGVAELVKAFNRATPAHWRSQSFHSERRDGKAGVTDSLTFRRLPMPGTLSSSIRWIIPQDRIEHQLHIPRAMPYAIFSAMHRAVWEWHCFMHELVPHYFNWKPGAVDGYMFNYGRIDRTNRFHVPHINPYKNIAIDDLI